jgi:sialate O-acetylesterase
MFKRNIRVAVLAGILVTLTAGPAPTAWADVQLPSILGSHMVLQQGIPLPVWGLADPGEEVTVTLGSQTARAKAGADGRWLIQLQPLAAGGGPLRMTVAGKNTIELKDLLVGEVWVCSGQSNMAWRVKQALRSEEEIQAARHPRIRLFTVGSQVAQEPRFDVGGEWQICSPETVGDFSAVGYFFGRDLHAALDVPVGLINTSWGGTPAESWTTHEALAGQADFKPILERWEQGAAGYPAQLAKWQEEARKAKEEGKPAPRKPAEPTQNPNMPAGLYNGMIHPIVPLAVRGAIWYQGESNAGRAYQYRKLLPAMIESWRQAWKQDQFTFLIVSLANFRPVDSHPVESEWAELREAQSMTAALPGNGQALAIDVGDAADIHPKDKQTVGQRLSLAALALAYKKDIEYSGPVFDGMSIKNGAVRLKFKHTGDGLVAKGGELKGFAIAGEDRKWVWAEAKIDGNTIVVKSDQVASPKAVRYGWANNPVCNLYNRAGLPAVPFRTDDWPGVTAGKN